MAQHRSDSNADAYADAKAWWKRALKPEAHVRPKRCDGRASIGCDWSHAIDVRVFPPHMYAFIPRRRPVARISQGGSYSGKSGP